MMRKVTSLALLAVILIILVIGRFQYTSDNESWLKIAIEHIISLFGLILFIKYLENEKPTISVERDGLNLAPTSKYRKREMFVPFEYMRKMRRQKSKWYQIGRKNAVGIWIKPDVSYMKAVLAVNGNKGKETQRKSSKKPDIVIQGGLVDDVELFLQACTKRWNISQA